MFFSFFSSFSSAVCENVLCLRNAPLWHRRCSAKALRNCALSSYLRRSMASNLLSSFSSGLLISLFLLPSYRASLLSSSLILWYILLHRVLLAFRTLELPSSSPLHHSVLVAVVGVQASLLNSSLISPLLFTSLLFCS